MPSPVDGTVWGTIRANPGAVVRLNPGTNPPETALSEILISRRPASARAAAISTVKAWSGCRSRAGHLGGFDRSDARARSTARTPPEMICPEGSSFYNIRARALKASAITPPVELLHLGRPAQHAGARQRRAGVHRQSQRRPGAYADEEVDHDESALPDRLLRKGLDGRIDDPKAGWKGRGLWTSSGGRVPWHQEGGLGMTPMAVHFQIRPSPLAEWSAALAPTCNDVMAGLVPAICVFAVIACMTGSFESWEANDGTKTQRSSLMTGRCVGVPYVAQRTGSLGGPVRCCISACGCSGANGGAQLLRSLCLLLGSRRRPYGEPQRPCRSALASG